MTETPKTSLIITKLYSSKHIGIATFIGGPLAAGYLLYENFKAFHKPSLAKKTLIIGIVSTVIIFGTLYSIPEEIIDRVPNVIIPAIYTTIVYFLTQKYQGKKLKQYEKDKGSFFSVWRVIGIGVISLAIILLGIFAIVYFTTDHQAYEEYDQKMEAFYKNEEEALKFYDDIDGKSDRLLLQEVNKTMIPKWEQNVKITEKIGGTSNLPSDLVKQNNTLLEYSKLRLELAFLIKESISGKMDKQFQIEEISHKIDSVLNSMK